jgi:serine phosphatase RsbU (regulator of sigma subunit)
VDHLPLDAAGHAVALGDVAGKALPAALLSVKLQATIRALAPNFEKLGDLGTGLNKILYRDGLPTRFASLVYLLLTPECGHVRALNAGHMPPLVLRDGNVTTMDRGGMVLGIMPETTFSEQEVDLNVGDVMIVYSDGVSEAMDESGDFYGDDRLHQVSRLAYGGSAEQIGTRVIDSVKTFIGHAKPSDDVSLMVIRRIS